MAVVLAVYRQFLAGLKRGQANWQVLWEVAIGAVPALS